MRRRSIGFIAELGIEGGFYMKKLLCIISSALLVCSVVAGCSISENKSYSVFPGTDWGTLPQEVVKGLKLPAEEADKLDENNHIIIDNFTLLGHTGQLRLVFDDIGGMVSQPVFLSAFFESNDPITVDEIDKLLKSQSDKIVYEKQTDYSRWHSETTISELTAEQELIYRYSFPGKPIGRQAVKGEWTKEEWEKFSSESKLSDVYLHKDGKSLSFNGKFSVMLNHFDDIVKYQSDSAFIADTE